MGLMTVTTATRYTVKIRCSLWQRVVSFFYSEQVQSCWNSCHVITTVFGSNSGHTSCRH